MSLVTIMNTLNRKLAEQGFLDINPDESKKGAVQRIHFNDLARPRIILPKNHKHASIYLHPNRARISLGIDQGGNPSVEDIYEFARTIAQPKQSRLARICGLKTTMPKASYEMKLDGGFEEQVKVPFDNLFLSFKKQGDRILSAEICTYNPHQLPERANLYLKLTLGDGEYRRTLGEFIPASQPSYLEVRFTKKDLDRMMRKADKRTRRLLKEKAVDVASEIGEVSAMFGIPIKKEQRYHLIIPTSIVGKFENLLGMSIRSPQKGQEAQITSLLKSYKQASSQGIYGPLLKDLHSIVQTGKEMDSEGKWAIKLSRGKFRSKPLQIPTQDLPPLPEGATLEQLSIEYEGASISAQKIDARNITGVEFDLELTTSDKGLAYVEEFCKMTGIAFH